MNSQSPTASSLLSFASLHISGTDEMGIVSDISNIIAKDVGTQMRAINIESEKGAFEGKLQILVYDLDHLEFLVNKLKKVKGVISVTNKLPYFFFPQHNVEGLLFSWP